MMHHIARFLMAATLTSVGVFAIGFGAMVFCLIVDFDTMGKAFMGAWITGLLCGLVFAFLGILMPESPQHYEMKTAHANLSPRAKGFDLQTSDQIGLSAEIQRQSREFSRRMELDVAAFNRAVNAGKIGPNNPPIRVDDHEAKYLRACQALDEVMARNPEILERARARQTT